MDASPGPENRGASPPWDEDAMDASFASAEVNIPSSSPTPADSELDATVLPPAPPKTLVAEPKAETPSKPANPLKRKVSPLETLKEINHSVQRVKVETTEIQAKSKFDREVLRLAAEKEREELRIADERARREHDRCMIDRQIELARLQQHLIPPTVQVPAAPAPRLYDGVNGIDPALFH